MGKRLNLSGSDWLLKGYLGEDWLWRDAHKATTRDTAGWIAATVPGSVQQDLLRAGLIHDPYYDLNSLLVEWVPARTWLYLKAFSLPSEWKAGRVTLVFEGVDYSARFFLNGKLLGTHVGMFSPAVFDVSADILFGAENRLAVVIDPAPPEQSQVGYTSRVRTTKSRMSYGWDFSPRLIDIGIWEHVYLEATGPVRIADVWARATLDRATGEGLVRLSVTLDSPTTDGDVQAKAAISLGQEAVESGASAMDLHAGQNQSAFTFRVSEPRLWWPNGLGDQPMYAATVRVVTKTGESDSRTVPFAFRDVKLVSNVTPDSTARPYTFEVNGRKVYIKGWNWVPLDPLYGPERPEKLERLMRLAQRGNINL
ncbi:MAG: glycoside hydrolase family 2 protein, partial [Rudaea sp.]